MTRAKNLATATLLLAAVIAIPAVLLALTGNPIPTHPSLHAVVTAFASRDDGTNLLHGIVWIGWLAWAYFTVALALEVISQLREHRNHTALVVPGFTASRAVLAPLVSLALGLSIAAGTTLTPALADTGTSTPAATTAANPTTRPAPQPSAPTAPTAAAAPAAAPQATRDMTYTVQHDGEALWSIAERFYDDGSAWHRIAAANPTVTGVDGAKTLHAGDVLTLPGIPAPTTPAGYTSHVVTGDDTLRGLAQRYLGDPDRWHDIYAASTHITQPDGAHLSDPDVIVDGWTLHIPTHHARADATPASAGSTSPATHPTHTRAGTRTTAPANVPAPATVPTGTAGAATSGATVAPAGPAATGSATSSPAASSGATTTTTPAAPATVPAPAQAHSPAATSTAALPPLPVPAASNAPTLQTSATPTTEPAPAQPVESSTTLPRGGIEAVGGVLAVCLLGILGSRWRRQAARRRPGQRIPTPSDETITTITALQESGGPLTALHLDKALRALSAGLASQDRPLPPLIAVRLDDQRIDCILAEDNPAPPAPFTATSGRSWSYIPTASGPLPDAAVVAPYPALVSLGTDADGGHLLVDLETLGALAITDPIPAEIVGALALGLAVSPWADDLTITVVGAHEDLPADLGVDRLQYAPTMGQLIDQLEAEANSTSAALTAEGLDSAREGRSGDDPDTWTPHVVLVATAIDDTDAQRLGQILTDRPRVAIAAVTTDERKLSAWTLVSSDDGSTATLDPLGLRVAPQRLSASGYASIRTLSDQSLSTTTEAAPWWDHDHDAVRPDEDQAELYRPADQVELSAVDDPRPTMLLDPAEELDDGEITADLVRLHQPTIHLLGDVRIDNVTGSLTAGRSVTEVLEPIIYVHLHPGDLTTNFRAALGTHTNDALGLASRARRYLGTTSDGDKLFPDAKRTDRGRTYSLHPDVTSDWAQLIHLVGDDPKVNTAPTRNLWRALDLVDGRPLASIAPGQWPWVETWRNDAICMILDVAHEAADRALANGDPNRAYWAIKKGLLVDPLSEVIARDELRLHRMTGNHSAAQDVIDKILAQCAKAGMDPDDETLTLIHSSNDDARQRTRA